MALSLSSSLDYYRPDDSNGSGVGGANSLKRDFKSLDLSSVNIFLFRNLEEGDVTGQLVRVLGSYHLSV